MTFVSWHFTGQINGQIYQGFENYVTSHSMPKDEEAVELHTDLVNQHTKMKHGFDGVTCEIIGFTPL
jgi:hypothetical protein